MTFTFKTTNSQEVENTTGTIVGESKPKRYKLCYVDSGLEGKIVNQGRYGLCEIIKYVNWDNVTVRFLETGFTRKVNMAHFNRGDVKDFSVPTVYGVGYNTLGRLDKSNEVIAKASCKWRDMMTRCYSEKFKKNNNTYVDCSVCDSWLDFKNFFEWFKERNEEGYPLDWHLDKDLLYIDNKQYSPETCLLVPRKLNNLLIRGYVTKTTDLPVGVHYHKSSGKYQTYVNDIDGCRINLGFFKTPEEAFEVYAKEKERIIKEVVPIYKDIYPEDVYLKLMAIKIDYNKGYYIEE